MRPDFATLLAHHRALHAAGRDESRNLEPHPSHAHDPRQLNVGQLTRSEASSFWLGFSEDARQREYAKRAARILHSKASYD